MPSNGCFCELTFQMNVWSSVLVFFPGHWHGWPNNALLPLRHTVYNAYIHIYKELNLVRAVRCIIHKKMHGWYRPKRTCMITKQGAFDSTVRALTFCTVHFAQHKYMLKRVLERRTSPVECFHNAVSIVLTPNISFSVMHTQWNQRTKRRSVALTFTSSLGHWPFFSYFFRGMKGSCAELQPPCDLLKQRQELKVEVVLRGTH